MPTSKELPPPMRTGCKFYEFTKGNSDPHRCKDSGSFTNASKLGQNPPAGTCKAFTPK
ncbi:hypothetical protein FACS1894200_05100 [Spirochaetia bacterium]|nr:hypothetical protein FACS1894200_05100 [Spirochaetia bacterium]